MRIRNRARVTIQSRITKYKRSIDCMVIEKITQNLPSDRINSVNIQIPNGISLADPQFNKPAKIDLLLGAKVFFDLLYLPVK